MIFPAIAASTRNFQHSSHALASRLSICLFGVYGSEVMLDASGVGDDGGDGGGGGGDDGRW